jgi:hypothetical protein
MDIRRLKRAVLIGVVATVVILGLLVVVVVLDLGSSTGSKPGRDVHVDLKANVDTTEYYWASVYLPDPLTAEEYREVAKSIGDEHFRARFGQAHVFDDEWARDMELPENQRIQLSDEEAARWQQQHVMSYGHDAKGY